MRGALLLCVFSAACTEAPPPSGTVTWSLTVNGAPATCDRLGGDGKVYTEVTAVLKSGERAETWVGDMDCSVTTAQWDAASLQAGLDVVDADVEDIDHLELDAQLVAANRSGSDITYDLHRSVPFADEVALSFQLAEIELTWQPIPIDKLGLGWGYTSAVTYVEPSSPSINSIVDGTPLPVHTQLGINIFDYEQGEARLRVALDAAEEVSFVVSLVAFDAVDGTSSKLDEMLQTAWIAPTGATVALPLDGNP